MLKAYKPTCRTPRHHRNYKLAALANFEAFDNGYAINKTNRLYKVATDRDDILLKQNVTSCQELSHANR